MIFRTLLIILICSSCQVNRFGKKQLIYDVFFEKVQVKENVLLMASVSYNIYERIMPQTPKEQIEQAKKEVDYDLWEDELRAIYKKHYSRKEAKLAILEIEKHGIEKFKAKPEINKEMHDLAKRFSTQMFEAIKAQNGDVDE